MITTQSSQSTAEQGLGDIFQIKTIDIICVRRMRLMRRTFVALLMYNITKSCLPITETVLAKVFINKHGANIAKAANSAIVWVEWLSILADRLD